MQIENESQIKDFYEDELNFRELLKILLAGKWIIVTVTTIVCVIAVFYSLSLPNIYQSKVLLVPNDSSNKSNVLQNYSSLANIAGINLPSDSGEGNSMKAIKKLSTLSFFESSILPNIFLPNLMALEYWNPGSNEITYDKEIYDEPSDAWVRDYSYPQKPVPSVQESFFEFQQHVSISQDKKDNYVTVSVSHQSPYIAQKWAKLLIDQINNFYRQKDKNEAEKAVKYLNSQIIKTSFSEIKQVIAALLQQETQKLTLIEANEFYVYEYIDPPAVMENKSEPSRAMICIFGAMLGVFLSIFTVFFIHYLKKIKGS